MALIDGTYPLTEFCFASFRNIDETDHVREFDALRAESAKIDFTDDSASLVGALLSWQVADGYANYVVTKDAPLTVQHVPFMDAYTVDPALIKGLDPGDVRAQLARSARLDALFGRK